MSAELQPGEERASVGNHSHTAKDAASVRSGLRSICIHHHCEPCPGRAELSRGSSRYQRGAFDFTAFHLGRSRTELYLEWLQLAKARTVVQ